MNLQSRKLEDDLVDAIESKNLHQFRFLIETWCIIPDEPLTCLDGLSTFEKVLSTPHSESFIKICLENGSDFYRKNSDGFYPLYFAVESSSAGNLKTILKLVDEEKVKDEMSLDIQYLTIVNQKLNKSTFCNNYLHMLVKKIDERNEKEILEVIKLLIINGCNVNTQNDLRETPFQLLLKTQNLTKARRELIDYIIDNSSVDFHSHHDIINLMARHGIGNDAAFAKPVKDVNYMLQLVHQWSESKFIEEFLTFINFHGDSLKLLEDAAVRNLSRIVETIVKNGIDLNRSLGRFSIPAAYLACKFGYHETLKALLIDGKMRFKNEKKNLLHQLLETENIGLEDREKCFELIVADGRCTNEIVNGLDCDGKSPLYYACYYGYHEIVKELLRRGALLTEPVIENIDKDDLKEFLDENIKCFGDIRDRNCEILVNYNFLFDEKSDKEIKPLHLMTKNPKLTDLVLHPVLTSFLDLKWKKIDLIVYFNLAVYFCFMIFLGCFVISYFHNGIYNRYGADYDQQVSEINGHNIGNGFDNSFPNIPYNSGGYGFDDSPTKVPHAHVNMNDSDDDKLHFNEDLPESGFTNILAPNFGTRLDNETNDVTSLSIGNKSSPGLPGPPPPPAILPVLPPASRPVPPTTFRPAQPPAVGIDVQINRPGPPTTSKPGQPPPPQIGIPAGSTPARFPSGRNPETDIKPASPEPFTPPSIFSLIFRQQEPVRTKRSIEDPSLTWYKAHIKHFYENYTSYIICVAGVCLLTIYEFVQFVTSWKKYFFKFENWLDISMISLSLIVLLGTFQFKPEDFKKVRALMILILAAQTIQLIARISFLSMSLHMAIFKKVCKTFLKTIALYLILILAFAMSFYTLNDKSDGKTDSGENSGSFDDGIFSDPFISVITTVRMMLSDFEEIKIDNNDRFQGIMFLLFVILITVILFNLLNALAISDTQDIIKDAELVEIKKRITIVNSYEKLINYLNLDFANVFPEMKQIFFTPNGDKRVKIKKKVLNSQENTVISIHNVSKVQNVVKFRANHKKFWFKGSQSMKLHSRIVEKIVRHVKERSEKLNR